MKQNDKTMEPVYENSYRVNDDHYLRLHIKGIALIQNEHLRIHELRRLLNAMMDRPCNEPLESAKMELLMGTCDRILQIAYDELKPYAAMAVSFCIAQILQLMPDEPCVLNPLNFIFIDGHILISQLEERRLYCCPELNDFYCDYLIFAKVNNLLYQWSAWSESSGFLRYTEEKDDPNIMYTMARLDPATLQREFTDLYVDMIEPCLVDEKEKYPIRYSKLLPDAFLKELAQQTAGSSDAAQISDSGKE